MSTKMTDVDAWNDAVDIFKMLTAGRTPATTRAATRDSTPVVLTNSNEGRVVTVLRWEPKGWWTLTDAVGNKLDAWAHNTHPRVMARKIDSIHWDQIA